ncbi:MAG: tetratricopeptide repeat protein [Gemmataceae bacterium]|nr:tetratricopeptide repeat protein [Gemmataceae bacterium]
MTRVPYARLLFILPVLAAAAAVGAVVWQATRPEPGPEPEVAAGPTTPPSPYRNTRPEVRYVGDAACAGCHPDIAKTYRDHPMGRDLAAVTGPLPGERFGPEAQNPFDKLGFRFQAEQKDGRVVHRVSGAGAERADPVAFAVGSGARGRSYVVNHDGFLYQSPVSWYSEAATWGLSPGFGRAHLGGLPVEPACLFCHSNRAEPVEGTVNRYRDPLANAAAVGCERCHGPGELHVAERTAGRVPDGPDDALVNPKHLAPDLREAVCQQCHFTTSSRVVRRGRGTFDYRPGLPLEEYWTLFTSPPHLTGDYRDGNRPEQMAASRCYQAGGGKMGCTSCHDPHAAPKPEEAVGFYRGRCLQCHQEQSCSLPPATRREQIASDSCAACHMPRRANKRGAHVSDTDHRIVRRPGPAAPAGPPTVRPGEELLVPFGRVRPGDAGLSRDLGLALAKVAEDSPGLRGHAGRQALSLLDGAVARHPDDVAAWLAKAKAQRLLGRPSGAAEDLRAALAVAPGHEAVLAEAGEVGRELQDWPAARDHFARAAAVNPRNPLYRERLGETLHNQRDWAAAIRECREAVRLNPGQTGARVVLVSCLMSTGDRAGARAEFDALMAAGPPNPDELRRWFAGLPR